MAQNIIESRLIPFNLQSGDGVPIHISPAGTLYFDRIFGLTYQNLNGISTWGLLGGGGGGSTFTGGTVAGPTNFTNGLSANTFNATTYFGLPIDVFVTGGTYSAGTAVFTNNTGGTFSVSGFTSGGGGGGNSIGELTGDITAGPATASSESVASTLKTNLRVGSIGVTVDGINTVIQVGQVGFVEMPYSGTITNWSIMANVSLFRTLNWGPLIASSVSAYVWVD